MLPMQPSCHVEQGVTAEEHDSIEGPGDASVQEVDDELVVILDDSDEEEEAEDDSDDEVEIIEEDGVCQAAE